MGLNLSMIFLMTLVLYLYLWYFGIDISNDQLQSFLPSQTWKPFVLIH